VQAHFLGCACGKHLASSSKLIAPALGGIQEMAKNDRFAATDCEVVHEAVECSFKALVDEYQALTKQAVHLYERDEETGNPHRDVVQAQHIFRLGEVLKALAFARFPEAADTYWG
jgi:hypothetical protein